MSLLGSEHKERYEQMQAEVNRREIDWWLFRSNGQYASDDLRMIIEMIKNEFVVVGPFGNHFVKEKKNLKSDFYGIPLRHSFGNHRDDKFQEGLAYVATNGDISILLASVFDFLRSPVHEVQFNHLGLIAICVQTAVNHEGERRVVAVDCIENLKPLAFYEHPPNGRFIQAMEGFEIPESSALTLGGKHRLANVSHQELMLETTRLYNNFELGDLDKKQLSQKLYSFFDNQNGKSES